MEGGKKRQMDGQTDGRGGEKETGRQIERGIGDEGRDGWGEG